MRLRVCFICLERHLISSAIKCKASSADDKFDMSFLHSRKNGVITFEQPVIHITILPQLTTVGEAYPEKKNASNLPARSPELGPSLARKSLIFEGRARLSARAPWTVDLEVALLAERRARGRDGQRMRSPQLARCSRDQIRLQMAALARG